MNYNMCVCVFNRDSFVDSSVQLLDDSDTQTIHRNRGLQQCSDNARRAPDLPWHFGTWALVPWDAWIHWFFLKGTYGMLMDFYGILWEFHEFCRIEWEYAGIFTGFMMLIWNKHEYTGITTW